MNQFARINRPAAAVVAAVLLAAAGFVSASPGNDEQSLRRGAVEDVMPQQKYQSAIREAGGAYKEALRECAAAGGEDRQACSREAKATYDRDMAEARLILRGA
jgi:Spy/CpxP family protein refolding chaperone